MGLIIILSKQVEVMGFEDDSVLGGSIKGVVLKADCEELVEGGHEGGVCPLPEEDALGVVICGMGGTLGSKKTQLMHVRGWVLASLFMYLLLLFLHKGWVLCNVDGGWRCSGLTQCKSHRRGY